MHIESPETLRFGCGHRDSGHRAVALESVQPYRVGAAQVQFVDFTDRNVPSGRWCYAVRGVWFAAANPSEMKVADYSPLAAVDVP